MAEPRIPFINGEIYHIYNRGIARCHTFITQRDYKRALGTLQYYQHGAAPVKFSRFLRMDYFEQERVRYALESQPPIVDILAFCFMPNHYHLLLRQQKDNGISEFMSLFQNSYTRYENGAQGRDGALFLNRFKAVRIETPAQLLHVSRYIHLNPYSGYLVKTVEETFDYPWSSAKSYIAPEPSALARPETVIAEIGSKGGYKSFISNQADYQRELANIKHLMLEK